MVESQITSSDITKVSDNVSVVGAPTVGDGNQTVPTEGTAVALSTDTSIREVTITASEDNAGVIVVGGSTVVAAKATRRGIPLNPLDSVTIMTDNLANPSLDTTSSGDGVSYIYVE